MSGNEPNFISSVESLCKSLQGSIAFPESADPRVMKVVTQLIDAALVSKVFIFEAKSDFIRSAKDLGLPLNQDKLDRIVSVAEEFPNLSDETAHHLIGSAEAKGKDVDEVVIKQQADSRLFQAGELLHRKFADAALAGSVATTADVIRAGISTCGLAEGCRTVSGCFIMVPPPSSSSRVLLFSDCGVVPTPKPGQLIDIARSTADTYSAISQITKDRPRVAFLSFSTKGSAKHAAAERVSQVSADFLSRYPDILSDGELQFDAAFDLKIGNAKCPDSPVAGQANCMIFPDLNAGNIAYKITQRLGGYTACGPILQGLARSYSDLSRGSTVDDIYLSAMIGILRSKTAS